MADRGRPPLGPSGHALIAFGVAGLLRSLGVPGADIPTDEDERAGRYRSLVAGRRILVTGASGFIGSFVVRRLVGDGARVFALTSAVSRI